MEVDEGKSLHADRINVTPLAALHVTDYPKKQNSSKADMGGSVNTFLASHHFKITV